MRILNLGSLNFDKVYDVDHFVSEGETILCSGYHEYLGGKGLNQSLALARAGAEVYHAGAVGADGAELIRCLEEAGVQPRYIKRTAGVSGHAIIQKQSGQNCIIVCGGANQCVEQSYIRSVLEHFEARDILLLQNEISNVAFAMEQAKKKGMKIAFNASPITRQMEQYPLHLVDWFLINEVEGKALTGVPLEHYDEILETMREKFPDSAVVLTLGEKGVRYISREEHCRHGIYSVPVADTTAAGDTFCGYFLAAIAREMCIPDALKTASLASAITVSRNGASNSIPSWEDVQDFAATHPKEM